MVGWLDYMSIVCAQDRVLSVDPWTYCLNIPYIPKLSHSHEDCVPHGALHSVSTTLPCVVMMQTIHNEPSGYCLTWFSTGFTGHPDVLISHFPISDPSRFCRSQFGFCSGGAGPISGSAKKARSRRQFRWNNLSMSSEQFQWSHLIWGIGCIQGGCLCSEHLKQE